MIGILMLDIRSNKSATLRDSETHHSPYSMTQKLLVLLCICLGSSRIVADPSPDVYAICRVILKSGVEIEGFIQLSDYCENYCSINGICYINREGHKTIDYFNTTDNALCYWDLKG